MLPANHGGEKFRPLFSEVAVEGTDPRLVEQFVLEHLNDEARQLVLFDATGVCELGQCRGTSPRVVVLGKDPSSEILVDSPVRIRTMSP